MKILEIMKTDLSQITKKDFEDAIFLSYRDGITSIAPLGFSGDTIYIFGSNQEENDSRISIRNYCGNAELLIANKKGSFLFYGRFDCRIGIEFLASEYFRIFNLVSKLIESDDLEFAKIEDFKLDKFHEDCKMSEGFAMLGELSELDQDFIPKAKGSEE